MPPIIRPSFAPNQIDIVLAWRSVDYPAIIGPEAFIRLARPLIETLLGQRDTDSFIDLLADELDVSDAQARQIWTTLDQVTQRQIAVLDADADGQAPFMYVGPVDKVTRPFCLQHVGRVYTRAKIDKLRNGQLPDVFLTAGGWQCRHRFAAVAREDRLMRQLLVSGQRFFPVARRLKRRGVA